MEANSDPAVILTWRDIRDVLLFVPVIHIGFCFTFLLFYAFGFGRSIEAFYTPGDVFSVSFKDIAPGYIVLILILPISLRLSNRTKRLKYSNSEIDQRKYESSMEKSRKTIILASAVMLILSVLGEIIYYTAFDELSISSIVSAVFAIIFLVFARKRNFRSKKTWPVLAILVAFPFLASAIVGAQNGENDLRRTYTELADRRPRCGEFVIIRPIGEFFMIAAKDGRRALIDSECKLRFEISVPKLEA